MVAAVVLEEAGDHGAGEVRARASDALARLGIVVSGELLAFGPTSVRTARARAAAAAAALTSAAS